MSQPGWTPDGVTVNENKLPSAYNIGTVALPVRGRITEIDTATYTGAKWVVFPFATRVSLMEQVD